MTPRNEEETASPAMLRRRLRARGILLVLLASASFSVAAALVKAVSERIPTAELILFRNLFALPALLPIIIRAGGIAALATPNPMGHAARTLFGVIGMAGAFYGYAHLPLATVTALGFTMPLFLTMLAVPLLGESVGWRRGCAVIIGFTGVVLMVRPEHTAPQGEGLAVLFCLIGALAWALAMITIRKLGEAGESSVAIVFWFTLGAALLSAVAATPVWVWPTAIEWAILISIGLISALAQVLMTEAYRSGETSLLAPFEYAAILWTSALGVIFWREMPDYGDAAGMVILIAAGLYIWHREVKLGVRR